MLRLTALWFELSSQHESHVSFSGMSKILVKVKLAPSPSLSYSIVSKS